MEAGTRMRGDDVEAEGGRRHVEGRGGDGLLV